MKEALLREIKRHGHVITTLADLKKNYSHISRRGIPLDPALRPKDTVVWEIPKADGFGFSKTDDYTNAWVGRNVKGTHTDISNLRSDVNMALDAYCNDVRAMGFKVDRVPHPKNIPAMNFVYIDNTYGVYHTNSGERLVFFANFQHKNRKPEELIVYKYLKDVGYLDGLKSIRSPWFDEINGNYFYVDVPTRSDQKINKADKYLKANIQCFSKGKHSRTSFETVQFTSAVLGIHIIALELKPHDNIEGETLFERIKHGGTYHGNVGMTFIDDWCYFVPDLFAEPKKVTALMNYLFEDKVVTITTKDKELYDEALTRLPLNCVYLGNDKENTPCVAVIKEAPLFIKLLESRGIKVYPQLGEALGTGGGGFYCATSYKHADLTKNERKLFEIEGSTRLEPLQLAPFSELIYHGE